MALPGSSRATALPLLAALLPLALGTAGCGPALGAPAAPVDRAAAEDDEMSRDWKEVERLLSEQKLRQALATVQELGERAAAAGDAAGRLRAVVVEAQIATALGGYEGAVDLLAVAERPEEGRAAEVVDLYHARALLDYRSAYEWEIAQRERVGPVSEVPLTAWTADQIAAEVRRLLAGVWARRASWGQAPVSDLAPYLHPNNFPPGIRGTLRDAVTYLWAEVLTDSSLWRVEHSSRLWTIDLDALLAGDWTDLEPTDPGVHPLVLFAFLAEDLGAWHAEGGRVEAAFEARRALLEALHDVFDNPGRRRRIVAALEQAVEELGPRYPWWSMGMATLAEWRRAEGAPGSLVEARRLALAARDAHPDSPGGLRGARLAAAISAPAYSLEAMASDAPRRRSIRVTHANLGTLWFRAYEIDLETRLGGAGSSLLGDSERARELLAAASPVASWRVDLPPTPDHREHATYVTPPLDEPGVYLVAASADRLFRQQANELQAVEMVIGDLVLVRRTAGDALEVTVRSGADGGAVPGAEVILYRADYRSGHRVAARTVSDAEGLARFRPGRRQSYFVVARKDGQVALDSGYLSYHSPRPQRRRRDALVWTDRSVYRPHQELLFKVAVYQAEGEGEGSLRTLPSAPVRVDLADPNGEVVSSVDLQTNRFGTTSGAFRVPAGRLLGGWTVRTSLGGAAAVQVEEYKRPTFEVTLDEPAAALRLNRAAELTGEARYYFGLPLAGGELSWRVVREPVYPRWWWLEPPVARRETIAAGAGRVDAEGGFAVAFTPEADESLALSSVTYRFRLEVEVTDEGGETRSATRSFRLGFVAVELRLDPGAAFFRAGEPVAVDAVRSDLDGTPRPGRASWSLSRLTPPERTLLPAEEPRPAPRDESAVVTEGDRLQPRWSTDVSLERSLSLWEEGPEVASGELLHGEDGRARLDLEGLPGGAYRLAVATVDPYDARHEARVELLVVEERAGALPLPAVALAERPSVAVGETARLLVHSGLEAQEMVLELFRDGERTERRRLISGGPRVLEIAVGERHRGGFGFILTTVRDHQLLTVSGSVFVPWDDRRLEVELASFRDLLRPGGRETWTVRLSSDDGRTLAAGTAELLAYMYDRSLDLFAPHRPADPLALYPATTAARRPEGSLGTAPRVWLPSEGLVDLPEVPPLHGDRLDSLAAYGIGGMGRRMRTLAMPAMAPAAPGIQAEGAPAEAETVARPEAAEIEDAAAGDAEPSAEPAVELRQEFAETAFWEPHLTLGDDGTASFEFTVPDSVTEWSVWVHALTADLRAGSVTRRARTVKELLVRPYLPRFLREGDRVRVAVVVSNASERELTGTLDLLLRSEEGVDRGPEFGLSDGEGLDRPFRLAPGASTEIFFSLEVPAAPGTVVVEASARAGGLADGERRELPVLPGRFHLLQSRFAALDGAARRVLAFPGLAAGDDPSRIDERLVVTLDAQLLHSVLRAVPYLVQYPYDCTEQLLNRFLSTGIVTSLFDDYPAVARMAEELSRRETPLEAFDAPDPNRRMALEETPWLAASRGGDSPEGELVEVLDRRVARATRDAALASLEKGQTAGGGFPWWPGGPPSPYMTLYLLQGFSRALEFGVEVPREPVVRAWGYLQRHWVDVLVRDAAGSDCCWEMVTFLGYVLSSYPDDEWTGGVFSGGDRRRMLELGFAHWREHSPLGKAQLALTLARAGRVEDARLVFDSVMDSALTTEEEGTFWAPEERAWLWYNDTIDSHAFALSTLTELDPDDPRRHGLVHWLLLNKKLNQWKSTRSTAEVLYALARYLEREGRLAAGEELLVRAGPVERRFRYEPERFGPVTPHGEPVAGGELGAGGRPNQMVIPGDRLEPAMAEIVVQKETPGLVFASATWHFSTEKLPDAAEGDLFSVERRFLRRVHDGREWTLEPLAEGAELAVGDQVEVRLTLRARHAAEYVHLRDPRAAGFEPESLTSGYRWNLGIGWYEEVRDSGANFFFEQLPAGELEVGYRLRAANAGLFRTAPATLQSMYAPEFAAYSSGARLSVGPAR
ncbi:MAG: alpha-2-macroglobulin family protein [Thermoanaerobaculia bacterium]|nr:alpha-2-macroglobulin family protein [Thermoanaerobaculia bacterium]